MTKQASPRGSRAGAARSPQDTVKAEKADSAAFNAKATYTVAPGEQIQHGRAVLREGDKVTASMFAAGDDNDGTATLRNLHDRKRIVRGTDDNDGKGDSERAGGGGDNGGGTGAGPSGAQLIAAANGDPGSQEVVDAALAGTNADFQQAAEKDATPPAAE